MPASNPHPVDHNTWAVLGLLGVAQLMVVLDAATSQQIGDAVMA